MRPAGLTMLALTAVGLVACGGGTSTVTVTRTATAGTTTASADVERQFCNSDTSDSLSIYQSEAENAGNKGEKSGLIKYTNAALRLLRKGAPAVDCVKNALDDLALFWTSNAGLWGEPDTTKYVRQIRSLGRRLGVH